MKNIYITGSTGFVGTNLIEYLNTKGFNIVTYSRNMNVDFNEIDVVIHLAGKAHDLKNTSNSCEYYTINTDLTKLIFDEYLKSNAKIFITLSSVKAIADNIDGELDENQQPNPITHYGKSKLLAEQYIFSKYLPLDKKVFVLRPCMIHGPGNKGNLNLLYKIVSKGIPWPLGAFDNKRSFCSIDNLIFIVSELITRSDIESGIYNIADDEPLSTNMIISEIGKALNRRVLIITVSKTLIIFLAKVGDIFKLPLNSERLHKLTQNYVVSNRKIKKALGKDLPIKSLDGLNITLKNFNIK